MQGGWLGLLSASACARPPANAGGLAPVARAAAQRHLAGNRPAEGMAQGQGPKLRGKSNKAGGGYSTPAVVGDRIYLLGNKGTEERIRRGPRRTRREQVWSNRSAKSVRTNGPSISRRSRTPTVDGELLYALGSDGDLACLAVGNGKDRLAEKTCATISTAMPGQLGLCRIAADRRRRAGLHARRHGGHVVASTRRPAT